MKTTRIAFRVLLASLGLGLLLAFVTPRATAIFRTGAGSAGQRINAATIAAQPSGCITSPSGPISWWPFEGNANDFYATNNGALSGNPAFVSGKVGQALYFDGLDDQVKVTASGSTNVGAGSGFTIEMWINPQDVSAQRPLIEWGNPGSVGVHFWIAVPLAGG